MMGRKIEKYFELEKNCLVENKNVFLRLVFFIKVSFAHFVLGATYEDFIVFDFKNKSLREISTYYLSRFNRKFKHVVYQKNGVDLRGVYNSKIKEFEILHEYYGRSQLATTTMTYEDFCQFVSKNRKFLIKMDSDDCGRGVYMVDADFSDLKSQYEVLKKETAVLDSVIVQHHELSQMAPNSVNTLRIPTMRIGKEVTIIGAALRVGVGDSFVDNFSAGGIVCAVDVSTGRILGDAIDGSGNRITEHPETGFVFKDYTIPNWENVIDLVKDCSLLYEPPYIGWDVAVRENDCVVVEANVGPMIHVYQMGENGGKRKIYKRLLRKFKAENN